MPRTAITKSRLVPRFLNGSTLFNGSTSKIDCGATDIIGTGAVTVSAWIKLSGWGELTGRIIDNGKFFFRVSDTAGQKAILVASDGANASCGSANGSLILGKWFHVVATRTSAGVVNVYINGNRSGAANQDSGTPAAATTNTIIGNDTAAGKTFNGNIAEVKIFNSALTASQAQELYTTGSVSGVSSVSDYALDDQPSTYIDSIGGNNGTGTATTYSSDTPVQQRMVVRNFETSLSLITSQYAHIPNASQVNLNFGLSDFIVGGWFNINPASGLSMLMCKVSGSAFVSGASALGWELMYRGDQTGKPLQFRFNDGNVAGGLTIQTTSNTVGDGKWHHIAVAVDRSDKAHIYIDGKKIIDSTLSSRTGTWDSTGDFVIGARAGKDSSYLNGRISECFAYNFGIDGLSSLSQWENIIRNIYFNGKLDTDSLVLNLKLNEGAGSTAYDSSGNGNNGTIIGATWSTNTPSSKRAMPRPCLGSTKFNGSTSVIKMTNRPIYNLVNYSVSFWINAVEQGDDKYIITNGYSGVNTPMWGIDYKRPSGLFYNLRIFIRDDSNNVLSGAGDITPQNLVHGRWYRVTITDAGGSLKCYVNGKYQGINLTYTRGTLTLNQTSLGALWRTFITNNWNGRLADVKIFDQALTAEQAMDEYISGNCGVNPISLYELDDTPSTYVDSVSGINGTGTDTSLVTTALPTKERVAV